MKIVVTGGAGFIGSSVIRNIYASSDHEIINIDKLTYASNLRSVGEISKSKRYFFEKADICDLKKIREIFNKYKPDSVMHLAAESHVDRSIESASDFINTNIIGTYNMLEASREYYENRKGLNRHFIFHHISTDEVFGDLGNSSNLFNELTSYKPSSLTLHQKQAQIIWLELGIEHIIYQLLFQIAQITMALSKMLKN